jgi:2,4-dienoyl-CoA reductase-like NADH-dependent reductase (Old Yellow Enzyme family)/NADH dehydrogenase FAD-containing subunit
VLGYCDVNVCIKGPIEVAYQINIRINKQALAMSNKYPHLMSGGQIGQLQLNNKIVLAAMGSNFAGSDGHCTERLIAYYEARAKGGTGLIIAETSAVGWPRGATMPNMLGFSKDEFIPTLKQLTDRVHLHGSKIAAQLTHGGKMSQEDTVAGRPILIPSLIKKGVSDMFNVLSPAEKGSFIKSAGPDGRGPQYSEMSISDIDSLVEEFAQAALRAKKAGFDAIEIHGGHGYIIANFLSPASNKRTDKYGGSAENRARFLCEVIAATREETGDDFPLLVRIDAKEFRVAGGIEIADAIKTAKLIEQAGADAVDVSAYGNIAHSIAFTEAPLVHEPNGFVDFARAIKKAINIPVIGVGRIDPEQGEKHIAAGDYDFLAMGRKLIADPELPNKLAADNDKAIIPCIYCYVCVSKIFINQPMCCAVNHHTGREHEGDIIARSSESQKILVIGAGPAGMESARLLALKGHAVSLWEKENDLGGTARIAALAYEPNQQLISYLSHAIKSLPIDLELGKEADINNIQANNFDHIIVANGAKRTAPEIQGKQLRHVFDGDELRGVLFGNNKTAVSKLSPFQQFVLWAGRISQLLRSITLLRQLSKLWMPLNKHIVVIGGGLVGLELAEYLVERGRNVTVLEPSETLGTELSIVRRARVIHQLNAHGASLLRNANVSSIETTKVNYRVGDETFSVPANQVIIALGAQANTNLADALNGQINNNSQVHNIGDGREIGYIEGAMLDARNLVKSF